MTEIYAGDMVLAVPIEECTIGHPHWHRDFAHPEMDGKAYMVTWSGISPASKRPLLAVAGRTGHFCAGCFAKQLPQGMRQRQSQFVYQTA